MKDAEHRVAEIATCIYKEMKANPYQTMQGLYGENFGALLFLYYYADFTKEKKYTLLAEKVLNKLLVQLEGNVAGFSYSGGYAGIFYLFRFLQEKKFINLDFSDSEEIVESYLIKQARLCMQVNDYDFLHGSLGVALYFLKKNPNHPFLSEFIEFIYHKSEKESINHTIKWRTPYGSKERVYDYYLSLSHGMTSMVLFLCRILKSASFSASRECLTMLEGCMNYILLQEIDHTKYGSFFPNTALETNPSTVQSRVGWCFGDLGIAWALWKAGITLNNQTWQDKAIEVMEYATRRVNQEQTMVYDCEICHGSAGVAMVFRRFYLETHEEIFNEAWIHWIHFTMNFQRFDDGLAGFKTFKIQEWENDISLLNGISGIGLSFLSFIRNDLQEWDELFLLS
jgi:lantibiotic modifying enzyme